MYDEAQLAEQRSVSGEDAYVWSNLPQGNALSQPAVGINYEAKATAVPPALPARGWEGLRGAAGKLQMLSAHSDGRKWERLSLYSHFFVAGGLVRVRARSLSAINHSCPL